MHIIYHCYGGAHSSVTAAAIHTRLLSENTIPSGEELLKLPYYDLQVAEDHGYIRYMGQDEKQNNVYITSKHNLGKSYETIMRSVAEIAGLPQDELVFIDTMPYVNVLMMIGGYLSRRLGWVRIGRPIVIMGTKLAFPKFSQLVNIVKTKDIRLGAK
ncbi:MAG: DUF3189 family protein [Clostridia bacterium]|jgi:hypothetical protein|nr:DUF3189 family protein [Clostridia bacterium]